MSRRTPRRRVVGPAQHEPTLHVRFDFGSDHWVLTIMTRGLIVAQIRATTLAEARIDATELLDRLS